MDKIEYTFPCGKKKTIDGYENAVFNFMGEVEACLHQCPDPKTNGDINHCKDFIKYSKNL